LVYFVNFQVVLLRSSHHDKKMSVSLCVFVHITVVAIKLGRSR
jgi:hypothetical protein